MNSEECSFVLNEKTAGRRMTRQRQAIMEMLAKTDEHPTAEMVYEAVRKQLPEISLGTVYQIGRASCRERV